MDLVFPPLALTDVGKYTYVIGKLLLVIVYGSDGHGFGVDLSILAPIPDFARPPAGKA